MCCCGARVGSFNPKRVCRLYREMGLQLRNKSPKRRVKAQLREDRAEDSEFITISYWESVEAMSRFAGPDPRRIHNLPRDPEFLIELPKSVQVLHITASKGMFGT